MNMVTRREMSLGSLTRKGEEKTQRVEKDIVWGLFKKVIFVDLLLLPPKREFLT